MEEGVITGHPPPFKWWVICNPGVWGFTILDFWYIIFLTPYNEKVCGIDNFSRGLFCGILSYCGIRLNKLDVVFLIFGSIFDLV